MQYTGLAGRLIRYIDESVDAVESNVLNGHCQDPIDYRGALARRFAFIELRGVVTDAADSE